MHDVALESQLQAIQLLEVQGMREAERWRLRAAEADSRAALERTILGLELGALEERREPRGRMAGGLVGWLGGE